jgi:hypothetical protein
VRWYRRSEPVVELLVDPVEPLPARKND